MTAGGRARWPSPIETDVLRVLSEVGEAYGLALVKALPDRLTRASVYVTLGRMVDKGLIEFRDEDQTHDVRRTYRGIRRRIYSMTALGRRALDAMTVADQIVPRRRPQ